MARSDLPSEVAEVFAAGGAMGRLMSEVDWAATPVGAPARWPQSLRTAIGVCLESRFPMLIWWGPDLVKIYNDAYALIIGSKHPTAMGQRGRDCWPEIWDTIGPMLDGVLAGKGATYSEDQLLPLVRHGFAEECYFTFSYGPIRDETGGVGGVFTAVTETTGRVLGERRLATLRALAQQLAGAHSTSQVLTRAVAVLDGARNDVPCALAYQLCTDGPGLLAASGGLTGEAVARVRGAVAPVLPDPAPSGSLVSLPADFVEGVRQVMVLPVDAAGVGVRLVVGISPALMLDDDYASFLRLVAGQIAMALAEALGLQAERARAQALAELDEAKTSFFANISHEFRTPLTLLLGPADDALVDGTEPLGEHQRGRLELIRRNALRLLRLVNTLLDFTRLESGQVAARFQLTEVGTYTAHLAGLFRSGIERAGLTFIVDCPPVAAEIFVDREMWEKLVLNLLSNALKYTFEGEISVRLHADAEAAVLSVSDTGIGIDPAEQPKLFDRFHRVRGARARSFEGSGIGLALVADIVAVHGGVVAVDSVPGRGSTFTITIPAGCAHLPAQDIDPTGDTWFEPLSSQTMGLAADALRWLEAGATESAGSPATAGESTATDERPVVLVVDDNADMREYVVGVLGDSYRMRTAPDGAVALAMIRKELPDLVLSDVMMPNVDGFGLVAALRDDPDTAHLPVILVSARAGEEASGEGFDAGADDYLIKPFSSRELRSRVRATLSLEALRREHGRDRALLAKLETNQAMLDQAQRLARVASWEIDLASGLVTASDEMLRQLQLTADELAAGGVEVVLSRRVHPEDAQRVRAALQAGAAGAPMDYEVRIITPDGDMRTYRTIGEVERDASGTPVRLLGSNQDVTEQRVAEHAIAAAAAAEEAAAREHRIAQALQHSLLPTSTYRPDNAEVASYYRPGTEGTAVGGDWYDVIELGAGRAALVIGDVMGRGVRAAAVMGQLRAAVRAFTRLEPTPSDVLQLLDGVVADLGIDQLVTCVYAVYDPSDRTFVYANAGHLPPLLTRRSGEGRLLTGGSAPPLGTGAVAPVDGRVTLEPGDTVAFYTDGLVERRDRDIDVGVRLLSRALLEVKDEPLDGVGERMAAALGISGQADDVALLVMRVNAESHIPTATWDIPATPDAVGRARQVALETLGDWALSGQYGEDAALLVSELVTNAINHARPPIELRLRRTPTDLVIEVHDAAALLPRRRRPGPEDEHGRGLQLVGLIADRWGTRSTGTGKATWCQLRLRGERPD